VGDDADAGMSCGINAVIVDIRYILWKVLVKL
jgi:hypothetical protein